MQIQLTPFPAAAGRPQGASRGAFLPFVSARPQREKLRRQMRFVTSEKSRGTDYVALLSPLQPNSREPEPTVFPMIGSDRVASGFPKCATI